MPLSEKWFDMKFSDLMAKDAYNDIVGDVTNIPPKELGVSNKLPIRPGTTIKTPTGLKHYSGEPPVENDFEPEPEELGGLKSEFNTLMNEPDRDDISNLKESPDEEILEWLNRLNIREATDDPKFNSMLNKITKSNDLQKYDKMMFGITEPVTHSKAVHGNTFFVIGDELLDWLENLLTDMPPEMKERLTASYEDDPGNIGDWISQNTGIPMKILRDIHNEIATRDGYNITEFFYCNSAEEFNRYFRKPWEQYKSENM